MARYRTEATTGPLMRVSFVQNLMQGREQKKDDGSTVKKYDGTLILPKSDEEGLAFLKKHITDCVVGEWGEKGLERLRNGLVRNPILDGAGKEARNKTTGEIHKGLGEDVVFIRPNSNQPVKFFDPNVQPIFEPEGCPSGSWGYPVLNAYAWHNAQNGDGVSFGISYFQLVKKAEGDDVLGGSGGPGDPKQFFEKLGKEASAGGAPKSAGDMFA